MTKLEYIDFIRNSLQSVDQTAKYHHNQVAAAINIAINTVFYELYEKNPKVMGKALERYTTEVTGTCALDVSINRYTTTLTVDVVDLPRKTGGVYEIITPNGASTIPTTHFVPVTTMEGEQLWGSESSLPGTVIGFSWASSRIIEYWYMSPAEAADGVAIRLIKQFKSYANTDNVNLPYGQDQRIIDLTRQYMGAIPPKDLVNDNADIKVNG